jgi:predicted ferric reductase
MGGMALLSRPSAQTAVAVPVRPHGGLRSGEAVGFLGVNIVLIVLMWVRHGGLDRLGTVADVATGIGQVTALVGTFLTLVQLVLMSRAPWLDRSFGRDRLTAAHRWVGFGALWLILAHAVFTTLGFALIDGQSFLGEGWTLITTYDFVLMAAVSLGLFVAVGVSSVRRARRRISYETWFGIHLYAYLAIALGFAHQLAVGSDFVGDATARFYWVALYVATFGLLIGFRVATPIAINLRHRFHVSNVVAETDDVVSVYLSGRRLDALSMSAGQYMIVRFLTREGWWRAHPYSISAQPNGRWLRLTVKALGEDSRRLADLPVGTRAIVEGPYGNMTPERLSGNGVLLVAGGIGVTPLRALLEELSMAANVVLLYRARSAADFIFRTELDQLAERRGATVRYLVGSRRDRLTGDDPLGARAIQAMVPDVAERDVFLCGPNSMMQAVADTLIGLGVPPARVHRERFDE